MSIIKNYPASDQRYGSDTSVTIMTMKKDTALTSPPLPNKKPDGTSFTHPLVGYTAKLYLEVNNYMFQLGFYSRAGETVIIRAELDAAATGFIYGIYAQSANARYIWAENGYLKWYEGGTVVYQKAIDGKVHNFGYEGFVDNGTLKCKPYYDKIDVSQDGYSGSGSTISDTFAKAILLHKGSDSYAFFAAGKTWAIRIYEVMASSYPSASDTTQRVFHYYAALDNASTPVPALMETMYDVAGQVGQAATAPQGVTNHKVVGNFTGQGYGVQLHDLKWMTGSGFRDAMAIVCQDDAIHATSDADSPDTLTNGTANHDMAFRMADGDGSTVGTTKVVLPSGFNVSRQGGTYEIHGYELGELIYGRRPNWPIWADNLRVGKYVRNFAQSSSRDYRFVVNFMKNHCGKIFTGVNSSGNYSDIGDYNPDNKNETELIYRFEDVNNDINHIHEPSLAISGGTPIVEYHNRVACFCTAGTVLFDKPAASSCVFKYTTDINDCNISAYAGNLIPWSLTSTELNTQGCFWKVNGIGIIVHRANDRDVVYFEGKTYSGSYALLCADSVQADMTKFFDAPYVFDTFSFDKQAQEQMYYDFTWDGITASLPLQTRLRLLHHTDDFDDTIDVTRVMKPLSLSVDGRRDTNKSGNAEQSNKDRLVVGEEGGLSVVSGNSYAINVVCRDGMGMDDWRSQALWIASSPSAGSSTNYGKTLGLQFALYRSGNQTFLNLANNNVIAFVEVTDINSSTGNYNGKYFGFTQPFTLDRSVHTSAGRHITNPSEGLNEWFMSENKMYPNDTTYRTGTDTYSDSTKYYDIWRACMFRWQELMCDSSTTIEPTGQITAHIRLFQKNSTYKAPCAWDIHNYNQSWDDLSNQGNGYNSGLPYVGFNGANHRLYFADTERVLPYSVSDGKVTIVDCWFSYWWLNSNEWDMMPASSPLPAMTITLRKKSCQEPYHAETPTIDGTPIGTFTIAQDGGSTRTDSTSISHYTASVTSRGEYPNFIYLPDDSRGVGLNGFYHLVIKVDSANYEEGAMYTVAFGTPS